MRGIRAIIPFSRLAFGGGKIRVLRIARIVTRPVVGHLALIHGRREIAPSRHSQKRSVVQRTQ